jgi:hypothetical protein
VAHRASPQAKTTTALSLQLTLPYMATAVLVGVGVVNGDTALCSIEDSVCGHGTGRVGNNHDHALLAFAFLGQ